MGFQNQQQRIRNRAGSWTIEGLGLVATALAVGFLVVHPEPLELWALDFVVGVGFPGLLVLLGYWFGTADFSPEDQWTIAYGAIAGFILLGLLGIVVSATQQFEGGIIFDTGYVLVTLATFGAFLGMTGSMLVLQRRDVSPLQALGLTHAEEHEILAETDSECSDTVIADWLSATVITEADLLRLRILQFLRKQETIVPYSAIVTVLKNDNTLAEDVSRKELRTQLHHVHLPKLAKSGLITYDPEIQIARAREEPE